MDRYLTKNSSRRAWWEIPNEVLSAFLVSVCIHVVVDDIAEGSTRIGAAEITAYALVFSLLLLPLFFAVRRIHRRRTARKIAAALARCDTVSVPLAQLDAITGVRDAAVKINRLLDKGYLKRLEPDPHDHVLWLVDPRPAPEPEPRKDAPVAVLAKIRELNDAIDDPDVSLRIDRIEHLTAGMFEALRQRPELADDARRFVNYYLPTTLKLLETYRLMEGQSYQGQTIRDSREKIEDALDKLVSAIEQQQDRLFRSEALDVEAEIHVLETMMRSDGTME